MTSAFDAATALTPLADESFTWDLPDGWQQGRGAWGGLVVGALVRAVQAVEPEPVRSVSAQLMAPALVGPHRVRVEELRRGRSMTTWSVRAWGADGSMVAAMTVVTGAARATADVLGAPQVGRGLPGASEVPVAAVAPSAPFVPAFWQHLEFRPFAGLPMSRVEPAIDGWVRLREAPDRSAAWLLALVDSYWPAALAALDHMPPVATVTFTANLLVDPATVDPEQPLAYSAAVDASFGGYASELRRLRAADGSLIVENLQTIVVG